MMISRKWASRSSRWSDVWLCRQARIRRQSLRGVSRPAVASAFSVAIPHYNRGRDIHRPLCNLLDHPHVAEVVIYDDGSAPQEYAMFSDNVKALDAAGKIRILRREMNQGAQATKLDAVAACRSDWVLILDSDNTAFRSYLNALGRLADKRPDAIYCSPFAFPYFSFTPLAGRCLYFRDCCDLTRSGLLRKCFIINDGNYLVHRETYLQRISPLRHLASDVADVMVANYLWLSGGGCLEVLHRGAYHHRVDESSFWMRTAEESRRRVLHLFDLFEQGVRWQEGGSARILDGSI